MKYLILTDNILVLDHFFNLTKNLISLADFNTIEHNFFENLVVAYFFWPPCRHLRRNETNLDAGCT